MIVFDYYFFLYIYIRYRDSDDKYMFFFILYFKNINIYFKSVREINLIYVFISASSIKHIYIYSFLFPYLNVFRKSHQISDKNQLGPSKFNNKNKN